jgi:hypothetical protein
MRAFLFLISILSALAAGTGPTLADYVLMTPSASSCPQFVAVIHPQTPSDILQEAEIRGWIEGYLSGYVRYANRDLFTRMQGSSGGNQYIAGLSSWIENWCQANPGRDLKEGAEALIEAMNR